MDRPSFAVPRLLGSASEPLSASVTRTAVRQRGSDSVDLFVMTLAASLLLALAVLSREDQPPALLQHARLVQLPLEASDGELGRRVFLVADAPTRAGTLVVALDGATGALRWRSEDPARAERKGGVRGLRMRSGAVLAIGQPLGDWRTKSVRVLRASDGATVGRVELSGLETCVAVELEADGSGSVTTLDSCGFLERRDARTGRLRARNGVYSDGLRAQATQVPDETGDGVPELVLLSWDNVQGVSLQAYDGVTLEVRRAVRLQERFQRAAHKLPSMISDLQLTSTTRGPRLRVLEGDFQEGYVALLDPDFTGIAVRSRWGVGPSFEFHDGTSGFLAFESSLQAGLLVQFRTSPDGEPVSEVRLPRRDWPWSRSAEVNTDSAKLWLTFPSGSQNGDEPVLAAWDVATGREVWKSENLLR